MLHRYLSSRAFATSRCLQTIPKSHQQFSPIEHSGKFKKITGDVLQDGVNRYEQDFFETSEWTQILLNRMKRDAKVLEAMREEFVPPTSNDKVCFERLVEYRYDWSLPDPLPETIPTRLHVQVASLEFTDKQRHAFLLLVGPEHYDPVTDVVTLVKEGTADGKSPIENKLFLLETLNKIIEHVKNGDCFEDVPLDFRNKTPQRKLLSFPEEWIKPPQQAINA